jgi:Phage portal protein, SPP1 Gp6-like.
MLTYQDFVKVGDDPQKRMDFVKRAVMDHRASVPFQIARDAELYYKQQNVTIMKFRKMLYQIDGVQIPDNYSANYKLCSNFFDRLTTQRNQHLLGNGVTFSKPDTKEKLGRFFDQMMVKLGHEAQKGGVSFGFWNFDHLEVFGLTEFVPFYDEENGALMAGIRFWQVSDTKPMRATLYEVDGMTDYIWTKDEPNGRIMDFNGQTKRSYMTETTGTPVDQDFIYKGQNYEKFPIIPLFNVKDQSDLVGMRQQIDCYDFIESGFANNASEANLLWTITNAMGMDEFDMVKFRDQVKRVNAALIDRDGVNVEAHPIEAPYGAREALLTRLRNDMYEDYMSLDTHDISAGATTATQIEASYEPLNSKTDDYETKVTTFILHLLDFLHIDDEPTYSRSRIVNRAEEIQVILQASQFLPEQYITKKVLTILGDADAYDEVQKMMIVDERERMRIEKIMAEDDEGEGDEVNDSTGQLTEEEEE